MILNAVSEEKSRGGVEVTRFAVTIGVQSKGFLRCLPTTFGEVPSSSRLRAGHRIQQFTR